MSIIQNKKNLLIALTASIFIISIFLRFYNIALPSDQIFDEVYFPVFANNYLTQTDFYDAHPPLGKLFIALGIALFGNEPLGWRFVNAISGTILLAIVFGFTYSLTKRWSAALLALLLIAIEPMALVESRVGLINIYLALFSIIGLWAAWIWYNTKKILPLTIAMIAFGAATSVKWIGIGAFAAALIFWLGDYILNRKSTQHKIPKWHAFSLLLIPLIYILTFIPDLIQTNSNILDHFIWWHKSTWGYHAHLDATHPYGADWWEWAIMKRPIWLYYKSPNPGTVTGIIELGNIVTWIGGLAALAYTMITFKKSENKKRNLFLVLTYLSLYLPWMFIGRVKFIYHYFVPVLILLILLAAVLDEHVLKNQKYRVYGITFIILALAFFIYFLPLLMGIPISQPFYQHHMWFRSWI